MFPGIRGCGFPRFTWRKACRTSSSPRCRSCSTKIWACRTRPSRFTRAGGICRGSSSRCGARSWICSKRGGNGSGRRNFCSARDWRAGHGRFPAPHFFQLTLAFFWLLSFSSATHDIAADGFYMLATTEREQSFFVGIRNTAYRVATILAQGELVSLAGTIHERTGNYVFAWSMAFALVAGIFLCFGVYHWFILPRPPVDQSKGIASPKNFFAEFFKTFGTFFQKPKIVALLLFLLLYRLGEAQLVKMVQLFLLDPRASGGLGLTDQQLGLIYGKAGIIALILGGLLGGFVVARHGLKFWLWPMLLAIHLPDAVFIWLAYPPAANL